MAFVCTKFNLAQKYCFCVIFYMRLGYFHYCIRIPRLFIDFLFFANDKWNTQIPFEWTVE